MFTQIYLDTDSYYELKETILHELAHVAEHRYAMLKKGSFRREHTAICGAKCSRSNIKDYGKGSEPIPATTSRYGEHGKLFDRCLAAFHSRAKRKGATLDFSKLWL